METKKAKTDVGKLQTRLKHNQRLLYRACIKIEDLVAETRAAWERLVMRRPQ